MSCQWCYFGYVIHASKERLCCYVSKHMQVADAGL